MLMRTYNKDFYLAGRLSGAHAYAISLNAATYYLDYQQPVKLQADRIFYYCEGLDDKSIFACKKPMFLRGELSKVSSIQTQR
jgi:glycosyl transferase family 25